MRLTPIALIALAFMFAGANAAAADEDLGPPYGVLSLVDEVNAGDAGDPHALYEDPIGASHIANVLGKQARVLPMADDAQVIAYRLGAGKGLVAGKAYVLVVEYPEDTGRQFVVINRGGEMTRTYATGQTIGDTRESYTYPAPESVKYPLTGNWHSVRTLFYLGEKFQGIKAARDPSASTFVDTPQNGFWVVIGHFRKKDSPLDAGAAVARIRLFAVPDGTSLDAPVRLPPADLPKRHVFWREEMADLAFASADPTQRFFAKSIDVFDAKMKVARFLGVNTFARHLLVFGYTQYWDNAAGGGNAWYYDTAQPTLWGEMVAAATKHGMDLMPYYEYAGAIGGGSGGTPSLGLQRRCRPLGDRPNDHFSDVTWSESACVDVTDPAFLADVDKLLDATITRYKGTASFAGAWFRTRSTNWPVSFADATLARFGADANGGISPTRATLQTDAALLGKYYAWWFTKRRDFLVHIRDHLRTSVDPSMTVLFTSYIEEALHVPEYSDAFTPTDDLPSWNTVNATLPWQYRFNPIDWTSYVDSGRFLEMTTRMKPPTAAALAMHAPENDHSAPPADPTRYADVDGVLMTMPFSRLFTVSSPAPFAAFRAKSGLAIARHFTLNEEDGQSATTAAGPMSKRVGYFVSDVDHTGPYSMLAEARAVAFGDPRYLAYLSSSNFGRGFPEYTRAFNLAFLALPALPSTVVSGASSDPEVVAREIATPTHGTYYAVVNTGFQSKSATVRLPAKGVVHDLVAGSDIARGGDAVVLTLYPGELKALLVDATPAGDAGAPGGDGGGSGAGGATGGGAAGSGGCGCALATSRLGDGAASIGALLIACTARRRRSHRAPVGLRRR